MLIIPKGRHFVGIKSKSTLIWFNVDSNQAVSGGNRAQYRPLLRPHNLGQFSLLQPILIWSYAIIEATPEDGLRGEDVANTA